MAYEGFVSDTTRNLLLKYEVKSINCFVDRVKNALLFMLVQTVIFKKIQNLFWDKFVILFQKFHDS
jgi:hypothetical protein